MIRLWLYRGKNRDFYYSDDEYFCDKCKDSIDNYGILFCYFNKKAGGSGYNWYHHHCFPDMEGRGIITQNYHVIFNKTPPKEAIPIFVQPPELKPMQDSVDVFEAAELHSDVVVDNTVYARREDLSLEGATIGAPLLDDGKDRDLKPQDAMRLLLENANAVPEIEILRLERDKEKQKEIGGKDANIKTC